MPDLTCPNCNATLSLVETQSLSLVAAPPAPPVPAPTPTPAPTPVPAPQPTPAPSAAPVTTYFNSLEPGGDGSDPNVLFADDFSRGFWFKDYSGPSLANAGWQGTPYGSPDPLGTNFGRVGLGVGGTTCVSNGGHTSTNGVPDQGQARGMADHSLARPVTELYFRYYIKFLPGYVPGQEKGLTFNKGGAGFGGIYAGCVFYGDTATGGPPPTPKFQDQNGDKMLVQNQGNDFQITYGNFAAVQVHIKYVAPGQDVLEMWMDDCGPDGTQHPAHPTLRMRYTDRTLRPAGDTSPSIDSVWIENWADPPAEGECLYDQIKVVETGGPIGFVGQ